MRLSFLAKKLFRTLARIIPQCRTLSQAIAFNMFLAVFSSLLGVLGLMSSSLRGDSGRELTLRLSTILPPGVWELVSEFLLRREVTPWPWELLGWVGTLLVGTQAMKLVIEGTHFIYGDRARHSFLGGQILGLLLFCVMIGTWLAAVGFTVYSQPLRQWTPQEFGLSILVRSFWTVIVPVLGVILRMLVLALIYRVAEPAETTWRSVLPGAAVGAMLLWGLDLLFGIFIGKTQYRPVYGGLAAAIGLMLRLEASAMIIFLGAAWNVESAGYGAGPSVTE